MSTGWIVTRRKDSTQIARWAAAGEPYRYELRYRVQDRSRMLGSFSLAVIGANWKDGGTYRGWTNNQQAAKEIRAIARALGFDMGKFYGLINQARWMPDEAAVRMHLEAIAARLEAKGCRLRV